MAIIDKEKFKCPHCGKEFESDIYKSVSVQDDEKYRSMLTQGDYFKFTCPYCGNSFLAIYPLSYTDNKNKFILQFAPSKVVKEILEEVKQNRSKAPADYTVRVCTSTYDLIEKMVIFESKYDDRAIELLKILVHKAFLNNFEGKRVTHIYFNKDNDDNYCFDILSKVSEEDKEQISRASFSIDLYNKIFSDFKKYFKDDDLLVDYGYALDLMKKMN